MRDFAEKLYKSKKWQDTRQAYMESKNWICERCGKPAEICHHKKYLTPANVNDPSITFEQNNLEALCRKCHAEEHQGKGEDNETGICFDWDGNLIEKPKHIIVSGAPGSGKTSYVLSIKSEKDILIDLDFIGCALYASTDIHRDKHGIVPLLLDIREAVYQSLQENKSEYDHAYIITTEYRIDELNRIAFPLRAKIVFMDVTREECKRRIKADPTRGNKAKQYKLADRWYDRWEKEKSAAGMDAGTTPPLL